MGAAIVGSGVRLTPTAPRRWAAQARRGLASILSRPAVHLRPVLVNGVPGVVVTFGGQPMTVMGFIIAEGRIAEIDAIADPERVRGIAAAVLTDE
jgi:hypothetical protein